MEIDENWSGIQQCIERLANNLSHPQKAMSQFDIEYDCGILQKLVTLRERATQQIKLNK